jgi:DNA-binding MarR family transcriptional regulator
VTHNPIPETLGYLLVQVCRAHRGRAQELLGAIDLHPGQEMLLLRLWPGDGLPQSQLAAEMCVQPATITKMLDRLERSGLVERRADIEDQRVSRVYLTAAGQAMQAPVEAVWQALEAQSVAQLTLEERLLLRRLLLQVLNNLT